MKILSIVVAVFLALASIVSAAEEGVCHGHFVQACSLGDGSGTSDCNSKFGGISNSEANLNNFLKKKLTTSYDYLLFQTHFDSHQKNRPGFKKLFKKLSDDAWEDTVSLIKYVTKRGGTVKFDGLGSEQYSAIAGKKIEVDEPYALAIALDSEKQLATDAIKVHQHASHMNHVSDGEKYDPALTHYMEEEFLEKQANTVRTLSGYTNDIKKLMRVADPSLNIDIFDEYLAKQ